jgi:hypothetical protein
MGAADTGRAVGKIGEKKSSGSRPGMAFVVVLVLMTTTAIVFGGLFCVKENIEAMKLRAVRIDEVGAEITEALIRQMNLYAIRAREYARSKSPADKSAALGRWFGKAELDAKSTYSYEEIREKFDTAGFDSVDRALTGLWMIEKFDVSLKEQIYEDDILVACRVFVEIEVEDGTRLLPPAKAKRWGKTTEITKMWKQNGKGISISIPMRIEGSDKNFWVE